MVCEAGIIGILTDPGDSSVAKPTSEADFFLPDLCQAQSILFLVLVKLFSMEREREVWDRVCSGILRGSC